MVVKGINLLPLCPSLKMTTNHSPSKTGSTKPEPSPYRSSSVIVFPCCPLNAVHHGSCGHFLPPKKGGVLSRGDDGSSRARACVCAERKGVSVRLHMINHYTWNLCWLAWKVHNRDCERTVSAENRENEQKAREAKGRREYLWAKEGTGRTVKKEKESQVEEEVEINLIGEEMILEVRVEFEEWEQWFSTWGQGPTPEVLQEVQGVRLSCI